MIRMTPSLGAPVLAVLVFFFTSSAMALPQVVHHDDVKHCHFLGKVHGSSGHGRHHGHSWKSIAKHRALVKGKKLGATHVVWHNSKAIGAFNGVVDGKAYACKSHH
jgi:hypothetical protein